MGVVLQEVQKRDSPIVRRLSGALSSSSFYREHIL
jgi:hypothetical protein